MNSKNNKFSHFGDLNKKGIILMLKLISFFITAQYKI